MRRAFGLALAGSILAGSVSARQVPKINPTIPAMPKGGVPGAMPGTGPVMPNPAGKGPNLPANPNPNGNPNPGTPGNPSIPGGATPATPGGSPGVSMPSPTPTQPSATYPTEIAGKPLEHYIREGRDNPDPGIRESCLRVIPLFGPVARKSAAATVLNALIKETDITVRLAGLFVAQNLGFEDEADIETATKAIIDLINHPQLQIKLEALNAVAAAGPRVRKAALPKVAPLVELTTPSWQVRRAATIALGKISYDGEKDGPDATGYAAIIKAMRDPSAAVRKEAIMACMTMGRLSKPQEVQNLQRVIFERVTNPKEDPIVVMWGRAAILFHENQKLKMDSTQLASFLKTLNDGPTTVKVEGYYAAGVLGRIIGPKAKEIADGLSNETDDTVLSVGLWALGNLGRSAEVAEPLLDRLARTGKSESVRQAARDAQAAINKAKLEEPPPEKKK